MKDDNVSRILFSQDLEDEHDRHMRATDAIVQALSENRCVSFLPDNDIVIGMRSGSDGELFFPRFAEIVDNILNQFVIYYVVEDTDDTSFTRLSSRLFNAIYFTHRSLAEVGHEYLQNRPFVVILGEPGSPLVFQMLQMNRDSEMIRNNEYFFTPSVYVSLGIFDVLAYAHKNGEDELIERFIYFFLNEEVMQSGLSYIRQLPIELVYMLNRTLDELLLKYHDVIQYGGNRSTRRGIRVSYS